LQIEVGGDRGGVGSFCLLMSTPLSFKPYVLILAGGSGERFWPLSRRTRPKHLLRLLSEKTLLEETVDRLTPVVPEDHLFILTNEAQAPLIRELLPGLPEGNVLVEPAKRDTAPAVALGVGMISRRDRDATMVMLPADHVIPDRELFVEDLRLAVAAAQNASAIVTLGVEPTWACPAFGYIEEGVAAPLPPGFEGHGADKLRHVARFREKPNPDLAESFLRSGNYRWNAGMFVWKVSVILAELERHEPRLAEFVRKLERAPDPEMVIGEEFAGLPKISIDYAVMERASHVLEVRAAFGWDDVGSWNALTKYLPELADQNHANTVLVTKDARENLVFSEEGKPVAMLGVNDLIVIQARDALLICHKHADQEIKQLIGGLPEELR